MGKQRSSQKRTPLQRHLSIEYELLRARGHEIVLVAVTIVYIALLAGRNLAYYQHVQGEKLYDIGFVIVPESKVLAGRLAEVCVHTMHVVTVLVACVFPFVRTVRTDNVDGPYMVPLVLRYGYCLLAGHILRMITYLSTTLPGPAAHCQPGSANYDPPRSFYEAMFRTPVGVNSACGDLIFSGHTLHAIMGCCLATHYTPRMLTPRWSRIFVGFCWAVCFVQSPSIIASRGHYTVDVLVGIYTTIFLWMSYQYWYTDDTHVRASQMTASSASASPKAPSGSDAAEIQEETKKPSRNSKASSRQRSANGSAKRPHRTRN